ncbi:efflux RND transporter periplasmic adaptor subunit [Thalassotalea sp. M1531]|uniref:Efflux RND transporter periplasmic adaptor subunit n=1 Tax=Thalassotalea algicola TaxID=2716224 RepID=A0A7Y0LBR1_9GAMM|nr:efflux RND transporter periplasmic adaptor subunit [Thalassotalea algicola]NMP31496.1 efflux RND transporter periplasmic adaptor subunit [Thalassotalea algicola]
MKIEDTSGQDVVLSHKSNNKRWVIISVVAVAILSLIGLTAPAISSWSSGDASISQDRVRLAKVIRGDLVRDLSVQGRVVAAISPRLYATGQGTITFSVDAGDKVVKDQELAVIESPELTNELKQEQASLQEQTLELERQKIQARKQALENQKSVDLAKVTLVAAGREKRRADKAYQFNSISQIDFEKAQDDLQNAELVYKHAEQDAALNDESLAFEIKSVQLQVDRQALLVTELQRKVDELTLRSPVNGIVGNLAVKQKNQVSRNQPILSVVDLSEFELEVDIPESYADDLAIGMASEITVNGKTYAANLVTISPEIENNQVTGRVRFANSSDNDSHPPGLRQNQRLTTRILMENKPNVLMVQRGQFLESSSGRFAYKVSNGVAEKVAIRTGARSLSNVEISTGLVEGDTIIVSGTDQFNDSDKVLITQ